MWTRKGRPSQDDVPPATGDLEGWLHDLTGGETTVRRLRKRLDAERIPANEVRPACCASPADHPGHQPVQRTA
ncbi:hypothetical protein [Modestobacter lapidis]|nr:hypothetical protein [Modestobacter lapidis]